MIPEYRMRNMPWAPQGVAHKEKKSKKKIIKNTDEK